MILIGLASGVGGALVMGGLYAFLVAVIALIRGRVRWAFLRTRGAAAVALAASLVGLGAGGAVLPPRATPTAANTPATSTPSVSTSVPATTATSPPPPSTTTPPVPSTTADPASDAIAAAPAGSALAALGTLTVQTQVPPGGYARTAFGQTWADTDRNGCDQRNDILRRDLTAVTLKADTHGCVVATGVLPDPYTGQAVTFTRATTNSPIEIDHVVALGNAWATGASTWDDTTRLQFANDPLNLLATSTTANLAKSDADAAGWVPPSTSFACNYVARQVAVKSKYHLTVSTPERAALARVLTGCPATAMPSATIPPLGGFPEDTPPPQPAPAPPSTPTPSITPVPAPIPLPPASSPSSSAPAPLQGVTPGAFCSPFGALGYTSTGRLMTCKPSATDSRNRWRAG